MNINTKAGKEKEVMKVRTMKKAALVLVGMCVAAGEASVVQAETPEEFWEYTEAVDDEDNIIYEFDELEVTLPSDWEDKYEIEIGEKKSGELYVDFYHPATREAYEKATGYKAKGAVLFTLNYSRNYNFLGWIDYTEIIGAGNRGVYFISYMQGEPGYPDDAEVWQEWSELYADLDWIEEHIEMLAPGEGVADPDVLEEDSSLSGSEYILADSSVRYLKADELSGLNADELQMAINEIYARHHRKFVTKSIQEYFDSKPWYSGTVEAAKFDETSLNQYEGKNIALMIQCMNSTAKPSGTSSTNGNTSNTSGAAASNGTTMYATTTVNIRSKASTSGSIMGIVPQGYSVVATGSASGGWIPVNYNGIKGYISQEYLKVGSGSASSGNTFGTQTSSGTEDASSSENIYDLMKNGGSFIGTILSKQNDEKGRMNVTVQSDDGSAYSFVSGQWTMYVNGEIGDYVQVNYLGSLNDAPQIQEVFLKSTQEELDEGLHTITGILTYVGNSSIGLQTEDGAVYDFILPGTASRPQHFDAGDSAIVQYMGNISAAEVVNVELQ